MAFLSRLFSVCPRVGKDKGKLVAATAWRLRVLTLGLLLRKVVVDPKKQELQLHRRLFWFFARRRRVRFGSVEAVTYGYQDWAFNSLFSLVHDSVDLFTVGLRLHGDDELHLFYFFGDGTFQNNGPWPDWLYWDDYLCDLSGRQEKESRAFVELLSKMIGVEIVPPRS